MADAIRKNELFTTSIRDLTNLGFGVAEYKGKVVFISGAVPGDKVEAKIIKVGSSFCIGKVENYIEYSKHRASNRCHIEKCRSCAYKCVSTDMERKLKESFVKGEFSKAGLSDIEVLPLVDSPKDTEYRNKAQYPVCRGKDGKIKIGFYAPKSHTVTEAADCPLSPSIFTEILEKLRSFFEKRGISAYNEESCNGLIRHIYLRKGESTGEVLLTLVINGSDLPHSDELVATLTEAFPSIVGILLNENTDRKSVV